MSQELSRFGGFIAAVLALGLVVAVFGEKLLFSVSGPETAIITRLKRAERDGLSLETPVGTLLGPKLQYQRISITLDGAGQRAAVTATLDFTGLLRRADGSETKVSSLGLERAWYRLDHDEWTPESSDAPRLVAIVSTLDGRRVAINAGAPAADGGVIYGDLTQRVWTSQAWFIRSEREEIEIAEDYRLTGATSARPVDEKATRRLSLVEDADGGFSFPGGIM